MTGFNYSNGWFEGFKSRFSLRSVKLVGEGGSSKMVEYETKLSEISEKISMFPIDCVYNMDEAGIFYRVLPQFSYILPSEFGIRGTKKDKNRLTVIFCSNATGTHKLPLTIIGKSRNPTCFEGKNIPVHYLHSKKAWINSNLFQLWFKDIFIKEVLHGKQKDERILLIMDNCSAHLQIEHEQIQTIFLPPNVTSTSQPFDQGIISAVKRSYRMNMLQDIIKNIELFKEMSKKKRKKSGIEIGGQASIYDASVLLEKSWDQISAAIISRCWIKSNLLNPVVCAQIQSNIDLNEIVSHNDKQLLENLCTNIQNICITSIKTQDHSPNKMIKQLKDDIERWIDVEEDSSIVLSEVEEQMLKKITSKSIFENNIKKDESEETNQNYSKLEQAKGEAKKLINFFDEKKWGDLCINIDENEVNMLTSILKKFTSESNF